MTRPPRLLYAVGAALAFASCGPAEIPVGGGENKPGEPPPQQPQKSQPLSAIKEPAPRGWELPEKPTNEVEARYIAAKDDATRIDIIGTKQASGPEDLMPLIKRALITGSRAVRVEAIRSTVVLPTEDAVTALAAAAGDTDPELRLMSVEQAIAMGSGVMLGLFEQSIHSPHPDVRLRVVRELGFRTSKLGMPILMAAIDDPDESVHAMAGRFLKRNFQREFESTAQAQEWWTSNEHRFNEALQATALE